MKLNNEAKGPDVNRFATDLFNLSLRFARIIDAIRQG